MFRRCALRVLAPSALRASDGQRPVRECIFPFRTALRFACAVFRACALRVLGTSALRAFTFLQAFASTVRNRRSASLASSLAALVAHWAHFGLFRSSIRNSRLATLPLASLLCSLDFRFACFAHCARRSSVPKGARFVRPPPLPSSIRNGRSASCAKRTSGPPLLIGLTTACFRHRRRPSCAPLQFPLKSCGFSGAETARKRFLLWKMGFSAAKIAPSPPYTPPGTIKARKGFGSTIRNSRLAALPLARLLCSLDFRFARFRHWRRRSSVPLALSSGFLTV